MIRSLPASCLNPFNLLPMRSLPRLVSRLTNLSRRFVSQSALFAACFALAGCAGFQATKEDQVRSMEKFKEEKFAASIQLTELDKTKLPLLDAKSYLRMISFSVLSMSNSETYARYAQVFALFNEGKNDEAAASEKVIGTPANKMGIGSAVAITEDGYLITAAHVIKHPNFMVLDWDLIDRKVRARLGHARTVFTDEKADFALLKYERTVSRCVEIRGEAPPLHALLFSGGLRNETGAGRLLASHEFRSNTGHKYRRLRSSIPVLPGDSGSAVIDTAGRLIRVTTNSIRVPFWQAKGLAVMLNPVELQRLIDEDRAKQR